MWYLESIPARTQGCVRSEGSGKVHFCAMFFCRHVCLSKQTPGLLLPLQDSSKLQLMDQTYVTWRTTRRTTFRLFILTLVLTAAATWFLPSMFVHMSALTELLFALLEKYLGLQRSTAHAALIVEKCCSPFWVFQAVLFIFGTLVVSVHNQLIAKDAYDIASKM
jgi:hypothetical protein